MLAHISLTKFVCMHANFPLGIIHVHPTLRSRRFEMYNLND